MYFKNVLCTVAFATLASAAVAKQIPTPYPSEATDEDEVFERYPARTAAWEQAHGGAAPSYHYSEAHDAGAWHVARDAEAEPAWNDKDGKAPAWANFLKHKATKAADAVKSAIPTAKLSKPKTKQSAPLKKHHSKKHATKTARDVEDEYDEEFDDEDYENLAARDVDDLEIPDFGDEEVDTSLEGMTGGPIHARDADDEDHEEFIGEEDEDYLAKRNADDDDDDEEHPGFIDESEQDLSGYDEDILQRRSDGTADEIDYSLEGLEGADDEDEADLQARGLDADDDADYDAYLHSEEHRSLLESIGVTQRDVDDDDAQDEDEFDEDLYARQVAEEDDNDVPDFGDEDVDISLEGMLDRRDTGEEIPDFGNLEVDTSLEGMDGGPVHARAADDDEDIEDEDDVDENADAAYANAEVVEELVAGVLGERDTPTSATAPSRGFFRIPW